MTSRSHPVSRHLMTWALVAACAFALAACSGGDSSQAAAGPAGPPGAAGPPGPPGAPGAADIGSAKVITATVTGVSTAAGQPTISFNLVAEDGRALRGLQPGELRVSIARLVPGTGGRSSEWQNYVSRTENPSAGFPGTVPTQQANTETATAGTLTDNQDGTYTYRMGVNITQVAGITYDASLTHRVALQFGTEASTTNNAPYTWQPSSGATTSIFMREVVDNDTCNACHDQLAFHGGRRFDLQYCVTCHNPGTVDAQSTNTLDLKVMVHKIHRGNTLPSVVAGNPYFIVGYRSTVYDFSGVHWPQDIRNCQTCHEESDANTPQASNYRTVANSTACGACHDDVNFATGAGHSAANLSATDDQCLTCHGPTSTIDGGRLRTEFIHQIPEQEAGKRFRFEVVSVTNTAPGQRPVATIRVVDPLNNNQPYNILAAGSPFRNSGGSLSARVAWSTRPDFTNFGSSTSGTGTPAQPLSITFNNPATVTDNGNGTFTATTGLATNVIPMTATGSGSLAMEGRAALDLYGDPTPERIPIVSVSRAFAITDSSAQAYRRVVDINKCNDCHKNLTLHGGNRTSNEELCSTCHNPNVTDINRRVAGSTCETQTGTLDEQSLDLKRMVHAIHSGPIFGYKACGFSVLDASNIHYPGKLNNCEGCHMPDTYYPVGPVQSLATTIRTMGLRNSPVDDIAISPNASVCSTCHVDSLAREHMRQNGGDFAAGKFQDGSINSAFIETCTLCHGPGKTADVKEMHKVGEFRFN